MKQNACTCAFLLTVCLQLGCVTRVQVCTSYDRRLGHEREQLARDSAGASVCADLERAQ